MINNLKPAQVFSRRLLLSLITVLVLSTLACSWVELIAPSKAKRVVIRIVLPTLTPTPNTPSSPVVNPLLAEPFDSPPTAHPAVAPAVIASSTPTSPAVAPVVPTATTIAQNAVSIPTETILEPTHTPTPVAVIADPTDPIPGPTLISFSTATLIPETPGWSFANIRTYTDVYEGGVLVYGDMINDTGASQELAYITGAFYNDQGEIIAGQDNTTEYWPVDIIPPGGKAPFELAVNGIQTAANYHLWANSAVVGQTPRQDFNFAGLEQWNEDESYCLAGQMQNSGPELQEYLVIAAVLYDAQGDVANFSETYETEVKDIRGDTPLDFEICVDPPNQNIAHYELRAWGE